MPQVTPNRTNHGRQNVAFRGTRTDPFAVSPAIAKSNRRRKRKLINEARRAARADHIRTGARKLVAAKRRWEQLGSAGPEYDAGLQREFDRSFEHFRDRYRAERAAHGAREHGGVGRGTSEANRAGGSQGAKPSQSPPKVAAGWVAEKGPPQATLTPRERRVGAADIDLRNASHRAGANITNERHSQ